MIKQPFPDSAKAPLSSQEIQRLRQLANHQHHAHFNLHPSDIYRDRSADPHHRKSNSIGSVNSILRPTSTHSEASHPPPYLPRRKPTLSHDSSSKHLLALRATLQEHPTVHSSLTHHVPPIQQKPRSSSVSINPKPSIGNLHQSNQLKSQPSSSSLRPKTPVLNEPNPTSQSLLSSLNINGNRTSTSLVTTAPYCHSQQQQRYPRQQQQPPNHRPNFLPVNIKSNNHHQVPSIGSIKHSLVESIHNLPCSLQDKLFFVAKLHAEVEAELTKLDVTPGPRSYSTAPSENAHSINTRQEIDDPVHLIKLSDRIKALAVSQLKQDLYR